MKFVAIIPARYNSVRLPGKPLLKLGDKPVIQHVYEKAKAVIPDTWVATDDMRIADAVRAFGGQVVLTSPNHPSGTDRCSEAASIIAKEMNFDVVINIQGDEPFVNVEQIKSLQQCFENKDTQIATLVKQINDTETLFNPNRPKVVFGSNMQALLFSRTCIPYIRGEEEEKWISCHKFYAHIGMYAYLASVLPQLTSLKQSPLELSESLEQLRWLENNYTITVAETEYETIGIDTPEDLAKAEAFLALNKTN